MEKIEPVFMVDLIELPAGLIATDLIPLEVAPLPKPVVVEPTPSPIEPVPNPVVIKPKQMPPPKAEFSLPPKEAASKSILQDLDQLTRLETSKPRPVAKKPEKALLEETFRELDALKNTPVNSADPKKSAPLAIDNPLDDFKDLKLKHQLSSTQPVTPQNDPSKELTPAEKKFHQLSQRKVELAAHKKDPAQTTSSLLKELEALEKIKTPSFVSKVKTQPVSKGPAPEIGASLKKKLAALQKKKFDLNIHTQIRPDQGSATEYSSEILKVKTVQSGRPAKSAKITTRQEPAKALPGTTGNWEPGALAISKYVGLVHVKVLENWEDPFGGNGAGQAQVFFYIFPEGNIGKPALTKSSGVAKLDRLALLAIKKSEPFPPFPKELKRPNLPITVNFAYVAE